MYVLDSSALLAYLGQEPGGPTVREALLDGAFCSSANWSEIAQKTLAAERDWPETGRLLLGFGLSIEPVTMDDAEWAAHRWRAQENLSLADRLCLALADRLDLPVLTADTAWGNSDTIVQIRRPRTVPSPVQLSDKKTIQPFGSDAE